jgi:hypothetical protein
MFGGKISWDPIVTNNYNTLYDESTAWTILQRQNSVEEFRKNSQSKEWIENGNWNPQGTHRSRFYNSYVNGTNIGEGVSDDDPFVGSPVNFVGMLVDCEPYGSLSSQLFFDGLTLGIEGGCRISLPRSNRVTARYINFFRLPRNIYSFAASVASVTWQTSFPKESLSIDAFDSAALQALKQALKADDVLGLTVRFNAYSTHYYGAEESSEIDALEQAFIEELKDGGFQPNPATSEIVGVVGLWRKGEPAHEPGDRAMLAAIPLSSPPPPEFVGSASARVSDNALVIDFSNSISETDLAMTKQDLGPLIFVAVDVQTSKKAEIATIVYDQYNREAYLSGSGIISIPLEQSLVDAARNGELLMQGQDGTVYLKEQALRAIPCDPNLYINEGETTHTDVLVLDKGQPAEEGVSIAMILADDSIFESDQQVTNGKGIVTFDIAGATGQVQGYLFDTSGSLDFPGSIDTQTNTYMYIRTLPLDGALDEIEKPTWDQVYTLCLSNWNAMAPCMDNWLDLKDEKQVMEYASMLKSLTDPENFERFQFMPVTRDMTMGQRNLLYRFLDGDSPASAIRLKTEAKVKKSASLRKLSRQMRSR